MSDARIMRSRTKIEATIDNAAAMVDVDCAHDGFRNYLRSHAGFEKAVSDLTNRFRCLGESGAYFFLQVVGEQVPPRGEWAARRR